MDILADFSQERLARFIDNLPETFYADREEAADAFRLGRAFHVIYMPVAFKFDLFPAGSFPIGRQEFDRAVLVAGTGLSECLPPFVTPEDILLAKLHWFLSGSGLSEVQWRDICGIVRAAGAGLDRTYLLENAETLGVASLMTRALREE